MKKDKDPSAMNMGIPVPTFGPLPSGNPYGHWETVPERYFTLILKFSCFTVDQLTVIFSNLLQSVYSIFSVPQEIDLQLPEKTNQPPKLAQPVIEDEPRTEFKEKSVTSVEGFDSGCSSSSFQFKKRKINRGNARQTTSDY